MKNFNKTLAIAAIAATTLFSAQSANAAETAEKSQAVTVEMNLDASNLDMANIELPADVYSQVFKDQVMNEMSKGTSMETAGCLDDLWKKVVDKINEVIDIVKPSKPKTPGIVDGPNKVRR